MTRTTLPRPRWGHTLRFRGRNVGRIIVPSARCRFRAERRNDSVRISLGWLLIVWWGRSA